MNIETKELKMRSHRKIWLTLQDRMIDVASTDSIKWTRITRKLFKKSFVIATFLADMKEEPLCPELGKYLIVPESAHQYRLLYYRWLSSNNVVLVTTNNVMLTDSEGCMVTFAEVIPFCSIPLYIQRKLQSSYDWLLENSASYRRSKYKKAEKNIEALRKIYEILPSQIRSIVSAIDYNANKNEQKAESIEWTDIDRYFFGITNCRAVFGSKFDKISNPLINLKKENKDYVVNYILREDNTVTVETYDKLQDHAVVTHGFPFANIPKELQDELEGEKR